LKHLKNLTKNQTLTAFLLILMGIYNLQVLGITMLYLLLVDQANRLSYAFKTEASNLMAGWTSKWALFIAFLLFSLTFISEHYLLLLTAFVCINFFYKPNNSNAGIAT
jgi:hypothetical protein